MAPLDPVCEGESHRCELSSSAEPGETHAAYLGEADPLLKPEWESIWLFWNTEGETRLTIRLETDCTRHDASGQRCCTLYVDHPGQHSFEIFDPLEVALRAAGDQIRQERFGRQYFVELPPL
ncbi:hypothetical protein OIE62_25395 [Streptomyces scopuliridis]|uniref:Uncharacterized protein n=1 Tax=Streptomyces scopuliridis TaxID=452529 RepID=A0ACD4ZME1_9ACTN|nr:hypothetical protein [Streptomyces scopuliridis]WSB34014.1 hypothetical protein OG949_14820 [Streptomyces scopuliridis]WSB98296.1 hypothetical protein OG835_15545 [Streptomyces scopuliridis]WSC08002.1 hypothetical protein OIE62_25395 [Streptomyces scopuliridis]